jgi:hypothetical protein
MARMRDRTAVSCRLAITSEQAHKVNKSNRGRVDEGPNGEGSASRFLRMSDGQNGQGE